MKDSLKSVLYRTSSEMLPLRDRLLSVTSRQNTALLLVLVFCAVAIVGAFVIRDLQAANAEAQTMYAGSVHGLQNIGELQYDAQETRRATLYALTTTDSNLQVEYADQSRNADQRVRDAIDEYARQASQPAEVSVAARLTRDWARYLSIRDEVLASILEGSIKEAVARDLADGVPSFELVRADLNEVKTLYDQDASQRLANVVATSHRAALRLIGILGFTFLLSSTAVWAIQRSRMLHAVQLGKLKMEFLASVSHELRTPLAVLNSAADNIADGLVEGTEELQKYGAILQNQSRRMGGLVDEILLFASTEDPKNRYTLQPLLVSQILESVVARTQELIHAQGFTLEEQVEPGLPLVMADLTGTSQCLQNLISNAVKYSGSNRWIAMGARTAVLENGAGQEVRIFVADRGIGIDRSELEYIFDPFWRSPRVNSAQIHGTGLGLSLTKRIAEAMGASVSVVSELSVGSTFTLHLRIAEGDGAQRSAVLSRPTPAPHP